MEEGEGKRGIRKGERLRRKGRAEIEERMEGGKRIGRIGACYVVVVFFIILFFIFLCHGFLVCMEIFKCYSIFFFK